MSFIVDNCDLDKHWETKILLQTFLSEGHTSYYTTVRGPDMFRNVIVSGCVTFYQINKFFVYNIYINFSLSGKCLRGPDERLRGPDLASGP